MAQHRLHLCVYSASAQQETRQHRTMNEYLLWKSYSNSVIITENSGTFESGTRLLYHLCTLIIAKQNPSVIHTWELEILEHCPSANINTERMVSLSGNVESKLQFHGSNQWVFLSEVINVAFQACSTNGAQSRGSFSATRAVTVISLPSFDYSDTYEDWYNGPHCAPELQVELCSCHVPEIEQALTDAVRSEVSVSFTPNLMPMILTSISQMEFPPTGALGLSHHDTQDVHLVNEESCGYVMFYYVVTELRYHVNNVYVVTEPRYDINNVYVVTEPQSDINNVYVVTELLYDVNNEGRCVMS
ncbi:unnamed protein product [Sphagnum jensenii]